MSFPNQAPPLYPFIPQFMHQPMGVPISAAPTTVIAQPPIPVPPSDSNARLAAFERPITTVFIGNISEKIPDTLMKDILAKCGNILSWKRVQGANGKLQGFGFCEYDNPEATLRCIRLLNEFRIADKSLTVKVDPKTDELLTEYKNKKQKAIEEREAEDVTKTEEAKKERIKAIYAKEEEEDKNSLAQIKKLIKDAGADEVPDSKKDKKSDKKLESLSMANVDMDNDKKKLISKEIELFRNKHKNDDGEDNDRYRRIKEREKEKRFEKEKERSKERHRHRSRSGSKSKKGEDERKRKRSRGNSRTSSVHSKKRRSGSKDTHHSKRSKRDSDKELDEYEAAMFKKLEKKLRDKEAAYQKRLQAWEAREKKKLKDYEMERERSSQKDREIAEEARKLQIFFEDYDDEKWDVKYYRGTELERRLNARKNEELMDEKDKAKELEQIELTRQRLIKEENPNAEDIILKMEQSMQEHLQKRLQLDGDKLGEEIIKENETKILSPSTVHLTHDNNKSNNDDNDDDNNEDIGDGEHDECDIGKADCSTSLSTSQSEILVSKLSEEEDKVDSIDGHCHFDQIQTGDSNCDTTVNSENEASISNLSNSEKKAMVKRIIDGIPTIKPELFAYPIEWNMVDEACVNEKIKPWVEKKIAAYIGEEEPSLSNFICDQVLQHKTPDQILSDIAMVLDEEADVFVMKMWRLLIYVIKAKKFGLD